MEDDRVFVENLLNKRVEQLMANPERFRKFLEYNEAAKQAIRKRFGDRSDWENIPIEEKCYHGWLRPYAFLSETIINGRWAYWHGIRAT